MSPESLHRRDSERVLGFDKKKSWRVIHACEFARDVLPVVDGQVSAGMRPFIVTPQGAGSAEAYLAGGPDEQGRSLSLLRSWQDVRNWRKSLLDCNPETSADLVHAHCFSAGMAAVRSCSCVVYDLAACIEELATFAEQCAQGSWMARSFRVAEQFVLSRASAVIVHSSGLKEAALQRGASADNIFFIPDPLPLELEEPALRSTALASDSDDSGVVSVFAPRLIESETHEPPSSAVKLLEGFALAVAEFPRIQLTVEAPAAARNALREQAERLKISHRFSIVDPECSSQAWLDAEVILAMDDSDLDPVTARRANDSCTLAQWYGKALLAADVPRNRDATPEGRGCVWFEPENPRDLGYRIAFLARSQEFRSALGTAGRLHVLETRSGAAIGKKYDEAYRHAAARRKSTGTGPGVAALQPAANFG